ncbi:hypothetical protein SAMN02745204_02054 [Thermomonas hydrothermalis]|uniref:Transposase n=1 Tax=Thermomonas hydrothermalis TaxID=213588 RepID=A0A1M4ZWL4_9GAMM|nr:hypothetical protein SAMN02745204_02054 [Thermomonas hydrothermalis]
MGAWEEIGKGAEAGLQARVRGVLRAKPEHPFWVIKRQFGYVTCPH